MSADGDGGQKQQFELYIKASAIDKETKGSCPICQHWFMITCLLGENQEDIDFKVYTVQADCPPKNFGVEQGWSKKFPVVMVLEGRDKKGQDLAGTKYDTFEELEVFFESINKDCRQLKRKNAPNAAAMKAVESVYNAFNTSLSMGKPNKKLLSELKRIDKFLEEEYDDAIFLVDNVLSFADCYLLPRLQHIRVAGKEYMDFDIPAEYVNIWRYLQHAYTQEAFLHTMPSDQDIVLHYLKKASNAMAQTKRRPLPTLQSFTYTLTLPDDIIAMLQATGSDAGANGANGDAGAGEQAAVDEGMASMAISQEQEQQQGATFDAEANNDDEAGRRTSPSPPPPPVVDEAFSEEQAALAESAPSPPQDEPATPDESPYESVTMDDANAHQAVVENDSPPPSPPPPPAADYEVGGGDYITEQRMNDDETNYVNVNIVHDGDGVEKVKVGEGQDEEEGEVKKEVGNGSVVTEDSGVVPSAE